MGDGKKKKQSGAENRKRENDRLAENKKVGEKLKKYMMNDAEAGSERQLLLNDDQSTSHHSDSEASNAKLVEECLDNSETYDSQLDPGDIPDTPPPPQDNQPTTPPEILRDTSPDNLILPDNRPTTPPEISTDDLRELLPSNCPTRDDVHMSEIREIDEGMNDRFKIDTSRNTFDPSTLVGLQSSNDEKSFLLRTNPSFFYAFFPRDDDNPRRVN